MPADDPRQRFPDISLAKKLLTWEPRIQLQDGLVKTIDYFGRLLNSVPKDEHVVRKSQGADRRWVKGNFNFSVYIPTYNYTIQCERKLPGSPRSYVS
jgi:hypothetical protein